MARLELSIFAFDKRLDFQSGYVRETLHYNKNATLRDILGEINPRSFGYQEFGVNLDFLHVRINNLAIFGNKSVRDLVAKLGDSWVIEPLSKKYAKKDLLLDYEAIFAEYSGFFGAMDFIMPSEKYELKKYLPLNFISIYNDENYCGDGFVLYVKWLMRRHPLQKRELLAAITQFSSGIFNRINVASSIFPANNDIDVEIESLQSEIVNAQRNLVSKEYYDFGLLLKSRFNFECNSAIDRKSVV